MIQLTRAMVRALAGAPMTVLVLLMIEKAPCAQAYIRRHTGFTSDHTIQDAVELLNDYGLIHETGRYTWQIADGVQQLPLGFEALPEAESAQEITPAVGEVIDVEATDYDDNPLEKEPAEIRSQKMLPNSMSSLESRSTSQEEKRLGPESSQESGADDQKTRIEQNLAECDAQGIKEPARTKISEKPHVTPEYIRYIFSISDNLRHAVGRMLKDWDSWSWKAKSVSMETVESVAVDEMAEAWWSDLVEKLRELLPSKAVFSTWVQPDKPARLVGDVLFVLASNEMVGAEITRHVCQDALNDLVRAISAGRVNQIRFVTSFPK